MITVITKVTEGSHTCLQCCTQEHRLVKVVGKGEGVEGGKNKSEMSQCILKTEIT